MDYQKGITQRKLCELLGLDYKTVATSAKKLGLSTHVYLQRETGWILQDELYYPPNDSSSHTAIIKN